LTYLSEAAFPAIGYWRDYWIGFSSTKNQKVGQFPTQENYLILALIPLFIQKKNIKMRILEQPKRLHVGPAGFSFQTTFIYVIHILFQHHYHRADNDAAMISNLEIYH